MKKIGLPSWLLGLAYRFVDIEASSPIIEGRTIEYGFALSKLVKLKPGNLLDIGCVARMNPIPSAFCELGWKVHGIDVRDCKYAHPDFSFHKGDITNTPYPDDFFNAITCISTLEHIGIKGRYGVTVEINLADMLAAREMTRILKDNGTLIVTVPFNYKGGLSSTERIYNNSRLEWIFKGLETKDERLYAWTGEYWAQTSELSKENLLCLELTK